MPQAEKVVRYIAPKANICEDVCGGVLPGIHTAGRTNQQLRGSDEILHRENQRRTEMEARQDLC